MKPDAPKHWTTEKILELARSYQPAAVIAAAAELDLFTRLEARRATAREIADAARLDARGATILLDALSALGLLVKSGESYSLAPGVEAGLTAGSAKNVLAMVQHQANCMRRWAQLARVVQSGQPAERVPSVRGEQGDRESFIGAMHNVSAPLADEVIAALAPIQFKHLLDLGGASGTWTAAFLRACPSGRATIFDLPEVIPLARRRLGGKPFADRLDFAPGDFETDALPGGADLVWVSAVVHQNSREQNRALFKKVFQALVPGGRIAIRDVLMEPDRTAPAAGALFAVNMLVATPGGGTFTFDELRADLESAGFLDAKVARSDEAMSSLVVARKP